MNFRTGQGIDFHQLKKGLKLWLGGVNIPSDKGCVAHSDGDVLLHAICDALLGAAASGDIGHHFPDTSEEFKNIDSKILLQRTREIISNKGYSVVNVDTTVCLQNPKIAPFIAEMRSVISSILGINPEDVSVKATTTENMGFVGRGEGIAAMASVLLKY